MGIIPARAGFTSQNRRRSRSSWDHPRSRGVYEEFIILDDGEEGSSPLARGLRVAPEILRVLTGIIPARAGFTGGCRVHRTMVWDHPRSRGVYPPRHESMNRGMGSSPLARGLPETRHCPVDRGRIIPARAGFTNINVPDVAKMEDHPRSRGVYGARPAPLHTTGGSSPLARGLHCIAIDDEFSWGIIPARAGFTPGVPHHEFRHTDHPRSRGVYTKGGDSTGSSPGSSPLARGLPLRDRSKEPVWGIIPARAGFTASAGAGRGLTGDHPRSRGVYKGAGSAPFGLYGSSPLARGLPLGELNAAAGDGIIPARAGFTPCSTAATGCGTDHPRSRGVYRLRRPRRRPPSGSSPLARGLHLRRHGPGTDLRIIPARAGFTLSMVNVPFDNTDHPRSRGVYINCGRMSIAGQGSSPLARGLPIGALDSSIKCRIIPARAGFTQGNSTPPQLLADHPRSRGVYVRSHWGKHYRSGSSPLARGLRGERP